VSSNSIIAVGFIQPSTHIHTNQCLQQHFIKICLFFVVHNHLTKIYIKFWWLF